MLHITITLALNKNHPTLQLPMHLVYQPIGFNIKVAREETVIKDVNFTSHCHAAYLDAELVHAELSDHP